MKCPHLTHSGHCAETTDRVPCVARLCAAKNEARPRHIDSMRGKTAQGRAEYIEIVRQSEGRLAADVLSDEVWRLIQARRDAAATRQEAPGGDKAAAPLPADMQGEKTAQKAGNLEN